MLLQQLSLFLSTAAAARWRKVATLRPTVKVVSGGCKVGMLRESNRLAPHPLALGAYFWYHAVL